MGVRISKDFWVEVLHTIVYVINSSPNTSITLKTLIDKWIRQNINFSNLRSFECATYANIKKGVLVYVIGLPRMGEGL